MEHTADDSGTYKRELIRRWTDRLYHDYEQILFQYRLRLKKPVIQVMNATSFWGQWKTSTRTIMINELLILNYGWDTVIEILKHEIAHQIVAELYCVEDQHGSHFRRACDAIGLADWARGASGKIEEKIPNWRDRVLSEEEKKLLRKVEGLLALSSSANEHEAALAMERVRQLYAKYNIDRIRERRRNDLVYCTICRKKKRTESFESMIFAILNEHFFVRCIHTTSFDHKTCEEYKAVEILGTPENVDIAEYVYHFLWNTLHRLWLEFQKKSCIRDSRAKRSYMLGVLTGFREKLASESNVSDQNQPLEKTSQILAKKNSLYLDQFVKSRYPSLCARSWSTRSAEKSSFEAGKAEGANLNINKGIQNTEKRSQKLLSSH